MQLDYLYEFVVFAHHLNMTRAAAELHMAQSNLSKHIKQLETEMGCALLRQRGGKMYLTEAGAHFLNQSQNILNLYERLSQECQALDETALPEITVQTPSLADRATEEYYRLIQQLKKTIDNLQIRYLRASHKSLFNSLKQGRLDLLLEYRCGDVDQIKADYRERGFESAHLCSENIVVWCGKDHRLAKEAVLLPTDLKEVPIMTPSDHLAPMRMASAEFCHYAGFEATFTAIATTTQEEFLDSCLPNSIYLYPASFTESPLIKAHDGMTTVPFAEGTAQVHAFAVTHTNDGFAPKAVRKYLLQR